MAKATENEEALYRVRELSYIDNRLVDAGEEVTYDGLPGTNLEPLNDAAKAQAALAEKQRRAPAVRTAPARRAARGVVSGDDTDDLA